MPDEFLHVDMLCVNI